MKKSLIHHAIILSVFLAPVTQSQAAVPLLWPAVVWLGKTVMGKGTTTIAVKTAGASVTKAGATVATTTLAGKIGVSAATAGAASQPGSAVDWKSLAVQAGTVASVVAGIKDVYAMMSDLGLEERPGASIGADLEEAAQTGAVFPIRACNDPATGKAFPVSTSWKACPDGSAPLELAQVQLTPPTQEPNAGGTAAP